MRVEGYATELSGSTLNVVFDGESDTWKVSSEPEGISSEFKTELELKGLSIMIEGTPQNGDSFSVEVLAAAASDMRVLVTDERKLAAAGLHVVEADIANTGDADLKLSYFDVAKPDKINDIKLSLIHI